MDCYSDDVFDFGTALTQSCYWQCSGPRSWNKPTASLSLKCSCYHIVKPNILSSQVDWLRIMDVCRLTTPNYQPRSPLLCCVLAKPSTASLFNIIGPPLYDWFLILRTTAGTAIARLSHCNSVCPSVTQVDQSKTVQARITKSSPSAAWKMLVSRTVKLFHKFDRGHPDRGR